MNTTLQSQLNRVEKELNTLIDSIAAYTPSIPAAEALMQADEELTKGLDQLSQHQQNYARIQRLQQTIDTLNGKMTDSLTLLAGTRTELVNTPFTTYSQDSVDVPYTELLSYARRISKFTMPPDIRAPPPPEPGQQTNGEKSESRRGSALPNDTPGTKEGVGISALGPEDAQWFESARSMPFTPWPSDDTIRQGALARIQMMPGALDDTAALERLPDLQAEDEAKDEDEETKSKLEPEPEPSQPPPVIANEVPPAQPLQQQPDPAKEEKPAVFGGLDLYDPEDD